MPATNVDLGQINSAAGLNAKLDSPVGIVSAALTIVIPLAGIILFIIIIKSGFDILTGAQDPKKVDQAKTTLTNAFIGFLVVFAAYWLAQIIEVVTGFPILSP